MVANTTTSTVMAASKRRAASSSGASSAHSVDADSDWSVSIASVVESDSISGAGSDESGLDERKMSYQAPLPTRTSFDTWDECDSTMDQYFAETNQVGIIHDCIVGVFSLLCLPQPMRVRGSVSISDHNKDTLKKKASRDAEREAKIARALAEGKAYKPRKTSGVTIIESDLVRYSKTWICTHAGKFKSRGKGKRQKTKTRAQGCKASVSFYCSHPVTSNDPRDTPWHPVTLCDS